ncbi:MAG: hypothetical protein Kow0081_0430 [Candidatus Dojkabacteria bacterium]
MMFDGLTGEFLVEAGPTPFQFVEHGLSAADLVIGNLECNISDHSTGFA